MKRLAIVAVGFALVVGVVVGSIAGDPFDGTASAANPSSLSLSAPTHLDCPSLGADFQALVVDEALQPVVGVTVECALTPLDGPMALISDSAVTGLDGEAHFTMLPTGIPCQQMTLCCHLQSDPNINACQTIGMGSFPVGGIAELPPLASAPGGSGMGGTTCAVLAGAAAGVLAFAVLAGLAVKRRGVR